MTEWRQITLRDVGTVQSGFAFKSRDWAEAGVPVVKIQNVRGGRVDLTDCSFVPQAVAASAADRYGLSRGDVLITMSGEIGSVGIVCSDTDILLNQRVGRVRLNETDPVLLRFIGYALQRPELKSLMVNIAYGVAQANISPSLLESLPLQLPPRESQRIIGEVLGTIDDLIENNRRRVEVLEEMARAIYREWFVHFRYPGHEHVPLVDSPLGPIPDGWKALTIGDVLELRYGKALKKDDRRGGPVAVVSSAGVVGWHDEALVEGPTIVVGRKGNVGSVTWVDGDAWPIDTAYFVASELPLRYVAEQLRGTEFLNTHAAVPGLSRDQAYSRPFLLPAMALMEEFDSASGTLAAEAKSLTEASQRLGNLRDLLLPKLVTGQIDVSHLDLHALTEAASA